MKHARNIAIRHLDDDGYIIPSSEYYKDMRKFLIEASLDKDNLESLDYIMSEMEKVGLEKLRRVQLIILIEMFSGKILSKMRDPKMSATFIDALQFVWLNGGPKEELIRTFKNFIIKEYRLYYNG